MLWRHLLDGVLAILLTIVSYAAGAYRGLRINNRAAVKKQVIRHAIFILIIGMFALILIFVTGCGNDSIGTYYEEDTGCKFLTANIDGSVPFIAQVLAADGLPYCPDTTQAPAP